MTEFKNQHFVPQFYFRGWTDTEKVPVYNFEHEKEFPPTSISNLCSDDYFYGDEDVEKSLGGIEERHARLLRKILNKRSFATLSDDDIIHLCLFIRLQHTRTKLEKEAIDKSVQAPFKEIVKGGVEAGQVDEKAIELVENDEIRLEHSMHAFAMVNALVGADQIGDLDIALIENETENEFIFSDHPVALDNRRFKDEMDRFVGGLHSPGLQIFCPVSADLHILLYDPECYFVDYDDEEAKIVRTDNERVVQGLNDVQMINAQQNVFYREKGREQEIQDRHEELADYIELSSLEVDHHSGDDPDFDTDNPVLETSRPLPGYSPYLPFVRQRKKAKFDFPRNPEIYERHRNRIDEIMDKVKERRDSEQNQE